MKGHSNVPWIWFIKLSVLSYDPLANLEFFKLPLSDQIPKSLVKKKDVSNVTLTEKYFLLNIIIISL